MKPILLSENDILYICISTGQNIINLLTLSFQHLVISYNIPVNENHEASV